MKNKIYLLIITICCFQFSFAQVGIATTSPISTFDVNGDLALREGTAITVAAGSNAITLTGEYSHYRLIGASGAFNLNTIIGGNDGQVLTLINATAQAMTVNNNNAANGILTGSGANLIAYGAANSSVSLIYNATLARWTVTGSTGTTNANSWNISGNTATAADFFGTTNAQPFRIYTNNGEKMRVSTTGNVGIGTISPDASSILDITTSNMGVSFPNINLLSETDATTIVSPKAGLMVYNTNTSLQCGKGLYFNNGTSTTPIWSCFTKTQRQFHAFNTAGRTAVNSSTLTLQPGCTFTFTIPTGQVADLKIDAVVGALNTSTTAGDKSVIEAVIYVDGNYLAQGGWSRVSNNNTSTTGNAIIATNLSSWVSGLTAGSHTVSLMTGRLSGSTTVTIGGNCSTDTNCGEIHGVLTYR